jgi:hypothetical protein
MKVFISHSTKDMKIIEEFKKLVEAQGIKAYVAIEDIHPGDPLWKKIESNIKSSNCLVALMTREGVKSGSVQNELGIARAKGIRIVAIVEKGVEAKGILAELEHIVLDRNRPDQALESAATYLGKLKKKKDEESNLVGILILAGCLAWIALASSKS